MGGNSLQRFCCSCSFFFTLIDRFHSTVVALLLSCLVVNIFVNPSSAALSNNFLFFSLSSFLKTGSSVCKVKCAGNHTFVINGSGQGYGFGDASKNQICVRTLNREISANFVCKKPMSMSFPPNTRVDDLFTNEYGGVAVIYNDQKQKKELWYVLCSFFF